MESKQTPETVYFFTQDDSSHWYMVPVDKRERWTRLTNRLPEIEGWDEYDYDNAIDNEFGHFRTNGGIDHIEFIPSLTQNK